MSMDRSAYISPRHTTAHVALSGRAMVPTTSPPPTARGGVSLFAYGQHVGVAPMHAAQLHSGAYVNHSPRQTFRPHGLRSMEGGIVCAASPRHMTPPRSADASLQQVNATQIIACSPYSEQRMLMPTGASTDIFLSVRSSSPLQAAARRADSLNLSMTPPAPGPASSAQPLNTRNSLPSRDRTAAPVSSGWGHPVLWTPSRPGSPKRSLSPRPGPGNTPRKGDSGAASTSPSVVRKPGPQDVPPWRRSQYEHVQPSSEASEPSLDLAPMERAPRCLQGRRPFMAGMSRDRTPPQGLPSLAPSEQVHEAKEQSPSDPQRALRSVSTPDRVRPQSPTEDASTFSAPSQRTCPSSPILPMRGLEAEASPPRHSTHTSVTHNNVPRARMPSSSPRRGSFSDPCERQSQEAEERDPSPERSPSPVYALPQGLSMRAQTPTRSRNEEADMSTQHAPAPGNGDVHAYAETDPPDIALESGACSPTSTTFGWDPVKVEGQLRETVRSACSAENQALSSAPQSPRAGIGTPPALIRPAHLSAHQLELAEAHATAEDLVSPSVSSTATTPSFADPLRTPRMLSPRVTMTPGMSAREREAAELRAWLSRETAERRRLETGHQDIADRIIECEAKAAGLTSELREARRERDLARQRLKDQTEKHAEALRDVRREQDTKRSLDDQISKTENSHKDLESKLRKEHFEKITADLLVKELQAKLQQFGQCCHNSVPSPVPGAETPGDFESHLEGLRRQLEDTMRVVHRRRTSSTAAEPVGVDADASVSAPPAGRLPGALALLDNAPTASPSAGAGCGRAAASSDCEDELLLEKDDDGDDKELPADQRLVAGIGLVFESSAADCKRSPSAQSLSTMSVADSPAKAAAAASQASRGLALRDLSEIRALKRPPSPVRRLMEVCCLLFQIEPRRQADERNPKIWRDDYWEPARRILLSDPFFPSKLRSFDAGTLSQSQRDKIGRYFGDSNFNAERVRSCSKAAYELFEWVRVVIEHDPPRSARRGTV